MLDQSVQKINVSYNRKSTEDRRQVQSIPDQIRINRKIAEERKLELGSEIIEEKSASTPYIRAEFSRLGEMMTSGKISYLFCWKLDRLARNPIEAGLITYVLQNRLIEGIITPERTYYPEDNALLTAVEFGMANQYSRDLSKNVKRGQQSKNEKGWFPSQAPTGYINEKYGEKGSKKILRDSEQFEAVKKLWGLALTGRYSIAELTDIANTNLSIKSKRGRKKMNKSSIYGILTNTFYYGEYTHSGKVWVGSHEPMITNEQFDKMQLILGQRGRARGTSKAINKYNGLFRCGECGYSIIPEPLKMKKIKSTGEVRFYKYWHCSHKSTQVKCTQKSITEDELEKALNELIVNIEMSDDFIKWSMLYLHYVLDNEREDRNLIANNIETQRKEVMRLIDELGDLYFDPANSDRSIMSIEEFKEKKIKLSQDRDKCEKALSKLSKRQDNVLEVMTQAAELARNLVEEFNKAEPEEKRNHLIDLGRTMVIKDRKVYIEPKLEIAQFSKVKKLVSINPDWLELTPVNKDKDIRLFEEIRSVWSDGPDSNRRPSRWQRDVLPTELPSHSIFLIGCHHFTRFAYASTRAISRFFYFVAAEVF